MGISDVTISWPASTSFRSQTKPPPIFEGDGFSGFALYPCGALPAAAAVTLTGVSPSGEVKFVVPVPTIATRVHSGGEAVLHKMFARSLIRDVENAARTASVDS